MNKAPKLYLIPVPIVEEDPLQHIPQANVEVVRTLRKFIAENEKTGRRNLRIMGFQHIQEAELYELNEHSGPEEINAIRNLLQSGASVGLMSDAGCPGIADPGAAVVELAHRMGIEVVPLAGPSSIVFAVMASGFNGQNFAFNGYLPIEKNQRVSRIRDLERLSVKNRQAQYFIETPYRNDQLFQTLMSVLAPGTNLFLGMNIGGSNQVLKSRSVKEWKTQGAPDLHKQPVVWGIYG